MSEASESHPFSILTPDFILQAIESEGYYCDGRILALNSYENRVYQIGIEDSEPLIAKFYRPKRWSDEQILEEHTFCFELAEQELPIVTPCRNSKSQSLFDFEDYRFSVFNRKGGHAPELDHKENLTILGRLLARIHLIGSGSKFQYRPSINIENYGYESVRLVSEHFIPFELKTAYDSLTNDLLQSLEGILNRVGTVNTIRVHGDCHAGNMLWRDDHPNFVDFDDSRMAPAIQDIWMLLSGSREQQQVQLNKIMQGYSQFKDFNPIEFQLIEFFRTLRIMYYSAWLAKRWDDPAFPHSFPWFNTVRYWEDHILQLREQFAALNEPAITAPC